jgi:hypothetical protein
MKNYLRHRKLHSTKSYARGHSSQAEIQWIHWRRHGPRSRPDQGQQRQIAHVNFREAVGPPKLNAISVEAHGKQLTTKKPRSRISSTT